MNDLIPAPIIEYLRVGGDPWSHVERLWALPRSDGFRVVQVSWDSSTDVTGTTELALTLERA